MDTHRADWLTKHMQAEVEGAVGGGLDRRSIVVTDKDGGETPASLLRCQCGGEKFHIYFIRGVHKHLQCSTCGGSYCDGTCE